MSMTEGYDDSPEREARNAKKNPYKPWDHSKGIPIHTGDETEYRLKMDAWATTPRDVAQCPKCLFAITGGAPGSQWIGDGVKHWVRLSAETPAGKCLTMQTLDAACGTVLQFTVDSSD